MKVIKYLLVGFVLGCTAKSEAVSWYRIYEMFQFQSFHMYYDCSLTGIIGIQLIKEGIKKDIKVSKSRIKSKDRHAIGLADYFFGFGWALVGACPGPILYYWVLVFGAF
jgi:hypothetical protein